jgi:uncharacterized damage-inducible protein DinB
MNYQETLAYQVRWAARNLTYNLGFLPADKLDWKPTPTMPSALEIVNHIVAGMLAGAKVLQSGVWSEARDATFTPATDLAQAKELLQTVAGDFAQALEMVREDDMERIIETPFGTMPLRYIMQFEPIDIIHHHGQVAYIQQLLGDTESHFTPVES